jgi:hypothetical protein
VEVAAGDPVEAQRWAGCQKWVVVRRPRRGGRAVDLYFLAPGGAAKLRGVSALLIFLDAHGVDACAQKAPSATLPTPPPAQLAPPPPLPLFGARALMPAECGACAGHFAELALHKERSCAAERQAAFLCKRVRDLEDDLGRERASARRLLHNSEDRWRAELNDARARLAHDREVAAHALYNAQAACKQAEDHVLRLQMRFVHVITPETQALINHACMFLPGGQGM